MDVVCFGQQNWDHCWTGKQQLLTRLVRRGHRALYVDPKWDRSSSGARGALRRLGDEDLHVFTYRPGRLLRYRGNLWRLPRAIRGACRELGFERPIALSMRPQAWSLMQALDPGATIYYAIDEITAYGGTPEGARKRLRAQEEEILRRCDLALAISPRLEHRLKTIHPLTYRLPSGADVEHFSRASSMAPAPELAGIPHPRIGYVGQIDERMNQALLAEVAERRPDWQFLLVGRLRSGVDLSRLEAVPNLHFLGFQDYARLPSFLAGFDVCFAPYARSELTESSSPLKIYEYLATGLPVVATPLDGLSSCRDVVAFATSTDQWISALTEALQHPRRERERRIAFAAENGWDHRVDELEMRMNQALSVARTKFGRAVRPKPSFGAPETGSHDADHLGVEGRILFTLTSGLGWAYYATRIAGRLLTGRRPIGVRRILVIRRRAMLGDTVAYLPALRALRSQFPGARIVLGVDSDAACRSLVPSTLVDEIRVISSAREETRGFRLRKIASLFAEGFDLVISGSRFFVVRAGFYIGAPWRAGLLDGHPLQWLNNIRVAYDATRHESENNLAVMEALGAKLEGEARIPELTADIASGPAGSPDVPAGARLVIVHTGSKRPSRRWPLPSFLELSRRILAASEDLRIVYTGVGEELPLVEELRARLPPELRERTSAAAGTTELPGLIRLLERADLVVSNDTGIMHVARALGRPLVAVLGPENDLSWGPHPSGRAPAIAHRNPVPCAPCWKWDCEVLYCLRSVEVEEVSSSALAILGGRRPAPDDPLRLGLEPSSTGTFPTLRLENRLDWSRLAALGFTIPAVSVVAMPGESLTRISRQLYPRMEVCRIARSDSPAGSADPPDGDPEVGRIPGEGDRFDRACWRSLLDRTHGELIVPATGKWRWHPEMLSAYVAAAVRHPEAAAILPRQFGEPLLGATAFRRSTLELALERLKGLARNGFSEEELLFELLRKLPVAYVEGPVVARLGDAEGLRDAALEEQPLKGVRCRETTG